MKKLFFTALVAVAAIGGAFAQNYYEQGQDTPTVFCPGETGDCSLQYPGITHVWDVPSASQTDLNKIEISTLPYEL